uniref:Uncharacterized protein n=1 Tax=Hucho hucho TaxID=62062 RepID=A0A4W5KQ50_9TELE
LFQPIPYVDINGFKLAESGAILEWLEDAYPTVSLLPPSTNDRARARELSLLIDHYLINASGLLSMHLLFGAPLSEESKADIAAKLARAVSAVNSRIGQSGPWLCGDSFSLADISLAVVLPHLAFLGEKVLGHDPLLKLALPPQYRERLAKRVSVTRMWQEREQLLQAFLKR